eukprot:gnl/Hemi2/13370_TR4592_c0_g6_i1.p1 gnl/Hemi2/13370_TR4592_c0_g6~~gnl/Hemi2/13370_TR4592_c0_g6_i1.p1  ORF type:complete len:480 (-),score=121.80 gnl/Hemi2/13370_TR4592_c0_g6_i1:140-1405(-)
MFILGIGTLFPWNVFINANDYYKLRFQGSDFTDNFQSFFGIFYFISLVSTLSLTLKHQAKWNDTLRIVGSFAMLLVVFIFTAILVHWGSVGGSSAFVLTIASIVICGVGNCFIQSGLFGIAAKLSDKHTQSLFTGQAFASVPAAIGGFMTSYSGNSSSSSSSTLDSALVYFLIACFVLVFCIGCYYWARTLPYFRYHVYEKNSATKQDEIALLAESGGRSGPARVATVSEVASKIWPFGLAVWFVFFTTLCVFPSFTSLVQSTHANDPDAGRFVKSLFTPLTFVVFALGDFFGRSLLGFRALHISKRLIFILSVVRGLFIPFMMMSNVVLTDSHGAPIHTYIPVVFANDVLFFLCYLIFCLTNGYLGTLLMMLPSQSLESHEQEIGGILMNYSLVTGLMSGAFTSFFLRFLLCHCNPFSSG